MVHYKSIAKLIILPFMLIAIDIFGIGTEFNSNCRNTLYQILNLNFKKADEYIQAETKANPSNLYIPYLKNYLEFVDIVLNEDPQVISSYNKNFTNRTQIIEKQDQTGFPERFLLLTEMNLQTSIISGKFNERFAALKYLYIAEKMLTKYPNYKSGDVKINKLLPVILLVNTYLPSFIKKWVPINQNPDNAFILLEKYRREARNDSLFRLESDIMTAFLYHQFKPGNKEIYSELYLRIEETHNNPFLALSVSLLGIRLGKQQESITLLTYYKNNTQEPYPFCYYLLGELKTNTQLDGTQELKYFLDIYKGKNYIKTAWQKLGWNYIINNDTISYLRCIQNVKTQGNIWLEADKNSLYEANMDEVPDINLLQARLLFDGGLYADSKKILTGDKIINSLKTNHQRLEYIYRLARVYHSLNEISFAKRYYNQVIELGKDFPYYYAANSSLQLANLYEDEKNKEKAEYYYKLCLKLNKYNYALSIGAKANEGLRRTNNL